MKVLIIVGGSGTRKTPLKDLIVKQVKGAVFIPSATSRPPRPGELDKIDYNFFTRPSINLLIEDGATIESMVIHGNLYATMKPPPGVKLAVYVVEYLGAMKLQQFFGKDAYTVCIKNDNSQVLQRVRAKGREADADSIALEAVNSLTVSDEQVEFLDRFAKRLKRELKD